MMRSPIAFLKKPNWRLIQLFRSVAADGATERFPIFGPNRSGWFRGVQVA